jgi:hypothetical protein
MKKLLILFLVSTVAITFGFTNAFAGPSAKATAQIGDLSVIEVSGSGGSGTPDSDDSGWVTLFTQTIKTPQDKDLFIDVSLECGLTTDTTVMSKKLTRAMATAEAIVEVRVLVDDDFVAVNGNTTPDTDITFARREQQLIAEFAGDFSECMTTDPDTGLFTVDWACADAEPETLQLILKTMQANSFNFVVPDLNAGEHTVQIQAKLSYVASGNLEQETIDTEAEGLSFAKAYLGNGSVTIETVRMIKGEDVIVDLE